MEEAVSARKEADKQAKEASVLMHQAIAAQMGAKLAEKVVALRTREVVESQSDHWEAHHRTDVARKQAHAARRVASLAQEALDRLSALLRPLKRSMDAAKKDSERSSAGSSCNKKKRSF